MDVVIADLATRDRAASSDRRVLACCRRMVAGRERLLVMRVFDNTTQDLLVVDPLTGDAREVTRHAEDVSHIPAGWLADGRALVITDEDSDHLWLGALDVATGKYEPIDRPDWDVELAASSSDGRTQIWSVNEDGYSTLRWRMDRGRYASARLDGAACDGLVISADGSRAAFTRLGPTEPWQVWTLDLATGDARIALASTFAVPRPSSSSLSSSAFRGPMATSRVLCTARATRADRRRRSCIRTAAPRVSPGPRSARTSRIWRRSSIAGSRSSYRTSTDRPATAGSGRPRSTRTGAGSTCATSARSPTG